MKIVGFSFIRNAVKYDYPIVEAITSILPICDEFVIAVGDSEDETLQLIRNIGSPKIRIIQTVWDDNLREGGRVLAVETDKAFAAISQDTDWCFYIQGDEVIHEKYLNNIKNAMQRHLKDPSVEGLLFHYLHFYGAYCYVGASRQWYRREIRIVRNRPDVIKSYRDAQGFRNVDNTKLKVKLIDAWVYHYGWVKPPKTQAVKRKDTDFWWFSDSEVEKLHGKDKEEFDYTNVPALRLFDGDHPKVMRARVARQDWAFSFDISKTNFTWKEKILNIIEKKTGWRVGEYRNYKLLR